MTAPLEAALADLVRQLVREEMAKGAPPAPRPPRLWSVKETADLLGLSRAFVYRELIASGKLRSRKVGGRRLCSDADVEAYIASTGQDR